MTHTPCTGIATAVWGQGTYYDIWDTRRPMTMSIVAVGHKVQGWIISVVSSTSWHDTRTIDGNCASHLFSEHPLQYVGYM